MEPIQGIHHVTAIASDPQANVDFYHELLGQRLIKKTINFDDPGTYHLYYGDNTGSPGTILTFFPWPGARRGVPGNGEAAAVSYAVHPDSLDYWRVRLERATGGVGQTQARFGQSVLPFRDPDGMVVELVGDSSASQVNVWTDGPVPPEHALRGFHGVTMWVDDAAMTVALLEERFGYAEVDRERSRVRLSAGANGVAHRIDLLERPGQDRGRMGAGTVHHVALRVRDDAEQLAHQAALADAGVDVTPVRDRQYFRSIYFREPSGVLLELATDGPGMTVDEPVAELGRNLKLPPWVEPRRAELEAILPPIIASTDAS